MTRIAVSGPSAGGSTAWWATRLAVARAGGRVVRVHPQTRHAAALDDLEFDGVVVGGGSNVDPVLFGQSRLANYARYDEGRDQLELALIESAERRKVPILAICRGMQLLNVSRGGTLKQDAWKGVEGDTRDSLRARFLVRVQPGTHLSAVVAQPLLWTNRLHRQSVDDIGEDLRASAIGQGGIIQALECSRDPRAFVLGVQWHPEYLPHRSRHQRLFHALVRRARAIPGKQNLPPVW